MYREETLLNVIKSVTRNGRSIVLTAVLALILVYLFSIVGYIFFKDDFILEVDRLPNSTLSEDWPVNSFSLKILHNGGSSVWKFLQTCQLSPSAFQEMEAVWPVSFYRQECVGQGLMKTALQGSRTKVLYPAAVGSIQVMYILLLTQLIYEEYSSI